MKSRTDTSLPLPLAGATRLAARRMASAVSVALCLAVLPATLCAQGPDSARREQLEQRLQAAKVRLNLTPEQEQKFRALVMEQGEKLRAIKDKYAGDASRAARRAEIQEARVVQEDFRTHVSALLTPDQMREWDRMRDEAREEFRERRQAASGARP
jgi:Spy/CpxP family protein refolding chaperone